MKMVEVKVSELEGAALDWAVAKAQGWYLLRVPKDIDGNNGGYTLAPPDFSKDFQFPPRGSIPTNWLVRHWSTDWSQGGPLIHKHSIELEPADKYVEFGNQWQAHMVGRDCDLYFQAGDTPIIAACRAIVAAKMGDVVSVPAELIQK